MQNLQGRAGIHAEWLDERAGRTQDVSDSRPDGRYLMTTTPVGDR